MEFWLFIVLGGVLLLVFVAGLYLGSRRKLPPAEKKLELPDGAEQAPATRAPEGARELALEKEAGEAEAAPADAAPELEVPGEIPGKKDEAERAGFFKRLKQGLSKTQNQLVERFDTVLRGRKEIDEELYEELETILLTADVGVKTTQRLLDGLRQRAGREELKDPARLREYLREDMAAILGRCASEDVDMSAKPHVIIVVGVNGVGKTTTIGKIASRFKADGRQVFIAAGDTFRAAAIEQLEVWADRASATLIRNKEGSDPSAVVFDAIKAAQARGGDVVIADTAGRLHTKVNLMEELKKVHRVAGKAMPGGPHEVLLVLDATMGQNALSQARIFNEGSQLTGLILTKLDGTAKGGVIVGICDELQLPVKFIGIGEKVDDLRPFEPDDFVAALF